MIEIRDLQLLSALARHRHFAKAAQDCGISQPAFSMRIRNLEERLGVSIVRRANRFQGLTEDGEMILRRGRRILDETRTLEQEVRARTGEVRGTLVIGAVPTAAAFAAQVMGRLHASHPGVICRIETATSIAVQDRLEDGTIDAGLTYQDAIAGDMMEVTALYEESYVVLAPDSMVARDAPGLTWAQAAELPLSLLEPGMQNRRILDAMFTELNLSPRVLAETSGFTASMVMAREGLAATVIPQVLADALGPLEGTRVLPLTDPQLSKTMCLATPQRQPELPTVRALKQVLKAV
ncbi:LysR family transcriptional regulator [Seohaeicola saemankumensis]|nr:LysR family transcriptional regulator [Seohaeicola saemankumensis]MCA0869253.1 LysR family transcriptional regulator [Seohaeicola saemankumensis]